MWSRCHKKCAIFFGTPANNLSHISFSHRSALPCCRLLIVCRPLALKLSTLFSRADPAGLCRLIKTSRGSATHKKNPGPTSILLCALDVLCLINPRISFVKGTSLPFSNRVRRVEIHAQKPPPQNVNCINPGFNTKGSRKWKATTSAIGQIAVKSLICQSCGTI